MESNHICGYPECMERRHGYSIFCFNHYRQVGYAEYNEIVQKEYWDNYPHSRHAQKERKFKESKQI